MTKATETNADTSGFDAHTFAPIVATRYGDRAQSIDDVIAASTDTMARIEATRELFWRVFGDTLKPRDLVALEFKTAETRTMRDTALLAIWESTEEGNT